MSDKVRLGIFFGGRSGEHEVSLMSARSVLTVLDDNRYEVIQIGITHAGDWYTGQNVLAALSAGSTQGLTPVTILPVPGDHWLYAIRGEGENRTLEPLVKLDVAFPLLHGTFGEDGTLQGLFELAELPYVGAGVLGSSVAMDKILFKDVMRTYDVPVLESCWATRTQISQASQAVIGRVESLAPYPIFTKPANLGSSVGVTKCRSRSDLFEGLMEAARFDRRILMERGLEAPREIEISVLGNDEPTVSLPGEVIPSDDFYTYRAKYLDGSSQLIIPAPLTPEQVRHIQEIALHAYNAIDCAGMARIDFLLDRRSGDLFVSEMNTIPGFTAISMYPKLWEASGLAYPALIDRLVELAFERADQRQHTEHQYGRGA